MDTETVERAVELAVDRLSQRLGHKASEDEDLTLVMAAFAHDQLADVTQHLLPVRSVAADAADWLES